MIIPFLIQQRSKLDHDEYWYQDKEWRWKIWVDKSIYIDDTETEKDDHTAYIVFTACVLTVVVVIFALIILANYY